ncbi:MAG: Regulatory protein, PemK family [archaeon GW2011_AR13]|nr:MAG: Regulatory protein, PemK family [archaeon GW2011_AR13]HIG94994.1 type II toxin-antitoxin system PemK/MazF family toxin [Nanoarchaeota archaeon]HIH62894.1 type II toxin-antitoxin system PemK/MazF family toxin [Nanoarchaeota archaeon]HIJ10311.1 type II toxin-antitoxin system PemK/MazF family toxin [Nanoarchaeota archaeon]
MEIYRGDILVVNLNPVVRSEQGGKRPVLVLQNNLANKYSPVVIVAAITSKEFSKEFPTNVFLLKQESKLDKDSTILLNQIRTIEKQRIIKKISSLDISSMKKVDMALKISLGLD